MATNLVNYKYGMQTAYDSIGTKDSNALYFIADSRRIYKGSNLIASDNVIAVTVLPTLDAAYPNVIYLLRTTVNDAPVVSLNAVSADGKSWVQLASFQSSGSVADDTEATLSNKTISADYNTITDLTVTNFKETSISQIITPLDDENYDADAASSKFVTENAVRNFIEENNANYNTTIDGLIKNVEYDAATGTFTFTKEDESTFEVSTPVENFLKEAVYDSATHILTLTLETGGSVEVNLEDLVPSAMNTDNVELTEAIPLVGVSSVGANTKGLDVGMNMTQILKSIFQKTINPTATAPSASLAGSPNTTAYEVGTDIANLTLTPTFKSGVYTYKSNNTSYGTQASEVALTNYDVTKKVGSAAATELITDGTTISNESTGTDGIVSYTLEAATDSNIHLTDDSIVYTVSATYGAGATPLNNMDKTQDSADGTVCSAIAAGTKSATFTINPYRNMFYGFIEVETEGETIEFTSDMIRGLANKTNGDPKKNNNYSVTWSNTTANGKFKVLVIALPQGYTLNTAILNSAVVTSIKETMNSVNVDVAGATAGADLMNYTVLTYYGQGANSTEHPYVFTLV